MIFSDMYKVFQSIWGVSIPAEDNNWKLSKSYSGSI